jgi:hypothetical protein
LHGLINLDLNKSDISAVLTEAEFKGYRFDGALEWIMKTIAMLTDML